MRCPSDAQAAALRLIAHEPGVVLWRGDDPRYPAQSRATLVVEVTDREANTSQFKWIANSPDMPRAVTLNACLKHGWLDSVHEKLFEHPAGQWRKESWTEVLREIDMTEDGYIALGLWQQRKLAAPPAPDPVLAESDREAIELAARAERIGYRLVPASDDARAQARRLTRDGWARRGFNAGSTLSLKATAQGTVEVLPETADHA